jgi:hypothetical protein
MIALRAMSPALSPASRGPALGLTAWLHAAALYLVVSIVFLACAWDRLGAHTSYNHFAHLADAWLHGRQDIIHGGPDYAHGNDFAEYGGKTYISFPPFPAALMVPFVALAGSPAAFRDGQFVVWLAGLAPAFLFLALERLRLDGRSPQTRGNNLLLAAAFAFGTVYFFTAVQGTVWFAGHVVGATLLCMFLLVAQRARYPLLAGLIAGCIFMTRPTMLLATIFFAFELWHREADRGEGTWRGLDKRRVAGALALYAAPLALALALAAWMNHARFHTWNPQAFGHEFLTVQWQRRIQKWGLFGLHYLPKNLGVALTSLPWPRAHDASLAEPLFRVNEHGLALWFTTPLYFLAFFPRRKSPMTLGILVAAGLPAAMNLLYQNSGWRQFGYRFSNDYSALLFLLLAVQGVRINRTFHALLAWSIGWNLWGAITFDRGQFDPYYFREGSQSVVYQPD